MTRLLSARHVSAVTALFCAVAPFSLPAQQARDSVHVHAGRLGLTVASAGGHLSSLDVQDGNSGRSLHASQAFFLTFSDGSQVGARTLDAVHLPNGTSVDDPHQAFRAATETNNAASQCWSSAVPEKALSLKWCVVGRQGTQYLREILRIQATTRDVSLREVRLLDLTDPGATVDGTVKGSPIVDTTMFFGFEHPLSTSTVENGQVRAALARTLPLKAGQSVTYSAVIGTAPAGQQRRGFLAYIEAERPRPYQAFLHYNSWYDIGYRNRFDEASVLDRIHAFGEELTVKRKVKMDSFLLDDGWDDTRNLWSFNPGFSDGLKASSKAAAQFGFGIGLWLSPWGGYGDEKLQRVAYGRAHGYEILNDGYALSGPKYFQRFEQTCQAMIQKYNVNQFKFDGTGNADRVFPGSTFDSDFDAAIHLIEDLRREKQDLFINLTTGTTASPFWLFYADSIWRGGEDHDFTGVGSSRQRWITYRDAQTFKNIVEKGPLFPLNSLMLHGIIYAEQAEKLDTDPGHDFADEVHSFFGSGTQTQEMYITPGLMSEGNWNTLAEAARWSRAHRDVLKDVHWLGGDPEKLQVYGWAAWHPSLGVITLRNPSDHAQTFSFHANDVFELTAGEKGRRYRLRSVWPGAEHAFSSDVLDSAQALTVHLDPFQVLTLELNPSHE